MPRKPPPEGQRFKQGQSGNPGGRPSYKAWREWLSGVETRFKDPELAATPRRELVDDTLFRIAIDKNHRFCLEAITLIKAYDLGRPRDRVELSGPDGAPIETEIKAPRRQTTGEMRKELAALELKRQERLNAKTLPRPTTTSPPEGKPDGKPPGDEEG